MLSKIMKRAHQLAKQMEGDYTARLSIALRQSWKESKEMPEIKLPKLIGSEKQVKWATEIREAVIANKEEAVDKVRKVADGKLEWLQEELEEWKCDEEEAQIERVEKEIKGIQEACNMIEAELEKFISSQAQCKAWIDTFKTVTSKYRTAAPAANVIGGIYQANKNYYFKKIKGNVIAYDLMLEVA